MSWVIKVQQKPEPETPRYYSMEVGQHRLTATVRRAAHYSTDAAAQVVADKLEPHPWGSWVVVEII